MIYRNALGQEVVFDNRVLYLEAIDMIGTPGVHTTESLAMSDGQRTIRHQLGAKTIPCSFAVKDVGNVEWLKNRLTEVFFPKLNGTMTVETMYGHYEIDCYPINVPSFRMAENDGVWRFDVDFVADYPYWRKGDERMIVFENSGAFSKTVNSFCPYDIAPKILFPASTSTTVLHINGAGFSVDAHDFPILMTTTPKFSMINTISGVACTNYLNSSASIGSLLIKYGNNTVQVVSGVPTGITLRYHDLSMGEM